MAFKPIKMMEVELSAPLPEIEGLNRYGAVKALLRFHGEPVGYVQLPPVDGRCSSAALGRAIVEQQTWPILRHLVDDGLMLQSRQRSLKVEQQAESAHSVFAGPYPLVTVAVCTRDRTEDLAQCLDALERLDYPALDLLVVDNAPRTEATEQLVRERYPRVRYVREPRPGLDWARNRAIHAARGEIVAYTDDDVMVDSGWVTALVRVFAEHPAVMAVTGMVAPYEIETEAQLLFEEYGGFGRGFERRWYRLDPRRSWKDTMHLGTGAFGTGANMAYRRELFEQVGRFDPALDVGTVTNGGGDLEMFYRVLKAGHTLVYEPRALVWHRHRRDYASLRIQLRDHGIGFSAYLVQIVTAHPDELGPCIWIGMRRTKWHVKRIVKSLLGRYKFPRDLILVEFMGVFTGLRRYQAARPAAVNIERKFGSL